MKKIKKTVKVFGIGNFNGKEFSKEKVETLIKNTKESIEGIFAHSSKWIKENKNPVSIGEFSNLKLSNNNVYADVELNEKGISYYEDGIIKGISAEISDKFDKIAFLPIGVNAAVEGAEFQDNHIMEFEELIIEEEGGKEMFDVNKMSLEEKLEAIKLIGESVTSDQKKAIRLIGYEFAEVPANVMKALEEKLEFEIKIPELTKTEKEIREEIRLEFEAELKEKELKKDAENLIESTIKDLKEKMQIIPAQEKEFELLLKNLDHSKVIETLEFEEDGKTAIKKSQLEVFLEFSKKNFKSYNYLTKENEFEEKEASELDEINRDIKGK